ncbi:catabolic enzyme [Bordetella pertussis]|nr:MmgE/PrpD family protein [Bordetella pertussis]UEB58534.1 MmgE/PrpD family protein [Bordetella pertussis]CFP51329.1 catabolic enzyme [Bordetella pertussis]CPI90244.1 catabolic enzyme [Bordetella pertussis]CPM37862.1 catabolic enzyme [Bordetella pertussis]CPN15063.1 catabolic enzyme [Bordetella pertussis]
MSMNEETAAKLQGLTRRFAKLVHDLKFEDLPEEVLHKAKLIIRDGLGNQIAASAISEPARRVVEIVREWGGKPEATVIGYGFKVPAPLAAMCNAMLGHGVELDDAHGSGLIKGGSVMIPSIMALAEANGKSGRDVITAIVAGYEVAVRIAKAINPGHRQRGFHTTGTVSLFGAAAGGAKLLGCDEEGIAAAIGLAAMQSAGIQSYLDDPCMAKPFSPGKSAFNGTMAAVMASRGFAGPRKALECKEGFFNAYCEDIRVDDLLDGLGERFVIMEVGFKPHAACRYAHGPIDLAQQFFEEGVRLEDVEKIDVRMCELSIRQASKPKASNLNAAMGSTEFGVALALAGGRNGLREYWDGFNDQRVHEAAADRTRLIMEPAYGVTGRQAAMAVTLKDGRVLQRDQAEPKGEPSNPLTDQELTDKFTGLVDMVETSSQVSGEFSQRLMRLEDEKAIADLIGPLKAAGQTPALRAA